MTEFYLKSADGAFEPAAPQAIMDSAAQLAQSEIDRRGPELSPNDLKAMIPALFAGRDHEFAGVAFLDSRMRLIEFKIMAEGSMGAVMIQPREVAKAALLNDASHLVLVHNHPGNVANPSENDIRATLVMRRALLIFDIKLQDHWIVTGTDIYSMEEHDLLGDDREKVMAAFKKALGL